MSCAVANGLTVRDLTSSTEQKAQIPSTAIKAKISSTEIKAQLASTEIKNKDLPMSDEEPQIEQRFPQAFYGDWRRISYLKTDANNFSERLRNPGKLCLSFRRTCYDFVRTAQTLSNRRVAVTWIVDGEWHDRERITVQSETKLYREVQLGRRCGWEILYIKGNHLLLTGFNGTYKYRAVFQKMHPPLKTITEEAESDG